MKGRLKTGVLKAGLLLALPFGLAGCYYEPGYYTRGDAYYGASYSDGGYYGPGYYDYGPGYYYGPSWGVGYYYYDYNGHRHRRDRDWDHGNGWNGNRGNWRPPAHGARPSPGSSFNAPRAGSGRMMAPSRNSAPARSSAPVRSAPRAAAPSRSSAPTRPQR